MMMNKGKSVEKHLNLWWVWNYEREQERLDALSERGLHLTTPGVFRSFYTNDADARYVYRVDYQPNLRKKGELDEYVGIYADAGWTHMGQCQNWHYFRRPWTPEKTHELYTDRESLKQHYKRIQRVLALVLILELIVLLVNLNNLVMIPSNHSLSHISIMILITVMSVLVVLLSYGCLTIQKRLKGMEKRLF